MADYKTIWISDIHLGSKGCKADQLCEFLKKNNCETLYLVGDIVDGWRLTRNWYWPQSHSNVLRRILTKAKRGTKVIYITGNHDEFFRPWLKHNLMFGNIQIQNQTTHVDAQGREWIVTHGDMFDKVTRNWRWLSMWGDSAYHALLMSNGMVNKVRSWFGYGYWSLSKWLKSHTKQAVGFIYKFEEHLAQHAQRLGAHGVICGHIHTPALKEIDGIMYINDGDWVETCSALVETHEGEFQLLLLDTSGNMTVIATYT
jgi:UDP-2,3-diacylglucosamine pyrophosphatase LpxH